MSDNTKQFRWIITIKENLELLFAEEPQVFVAGDLLWYPVEGNNKIRLAPDAMVVFDRPFLSFVELDQLRQQATERAEQAEQLVEKLSAKLRELGIDPNNLSI